MTWKSYAVVSGATVLAGWFAASPPSNAPTAAVPPPPQGRRAAPAAAADIQEQAARLQARVQAERQYAEPQRNLFRFEAGKPVDERLENGNGGDAPPGSAAEAPAAVPAPPPLTLSGIAEDQANGQISRTAVVSTPSGVQLVREGDELFGYRVVRVEGEAIELRAPDGRILRLSLAD